MAFASDVVWDGGDFFTEVLENNFQGHVDCDVVAELLSLEEQMSLDGACYERCPFSSTSQNDALEKRSYCRA